MKEYLVITEEGNGYHCGCCRQTWTEYNHHEFESDDVAKAWAEEFNENEGNLRHDIKIINIYRLDSSEETDNNIYSA